MAIRDPYDEIRSKRVSEIRSALQQRNLDQLRKILQLALFEYPNDEELENFQRQLLQMEHAANVADTLLKHSRRRIETGNYESGIAKLRQALQIKPADREIEAELFDALAESAKIKAERDPERARQLLHEAAELSPLNLRLEGFRTYIADCVRRQSRDECISEIESLPHVLPAVPTSTSVVSLRVETPAESPAPVHSRISAIRDAWRKTRQNAGAAVGRMDFRKPWRDASQGLQRGWNRTRGLFPQSPIAYVVATGVACLVLVFATGMIGRSTGNKPELVRVGSGILQLPVTLLRRPVENSGVTGALKAGEHVDILKQIPLASLDAWMLVRAVDKPTTVGYVRLQNLDQVQTADRQFDAWFATSFLERATSPNEFRKRLEYVDQFLKDHPLAPSRESDQICFVVSKAYARLAAERAVNPDEAEITRLALENSENYLARVEGALQISEEADALHYSIGQSRAAIDRPVVVERPVAVVAVRGASQAPQENEQTRILRMANKAYSQKIYETAAIYCTQVLKLNPDNKEARKLLAAIRQAQTELEASIIR